MLALSRSSLAALRAALIRDAGPAAASYLQEAGYAGGETLFDSFRSWLACAPRCSPRSWRVEEFERFATDYFRDAGWGSLKVGTLNDAVATLDSTDWGEADPGERHGPSRVSLHDRHVRRFLRQRSPTLRSRCSRSSVARWALHAAASSSATRTVMEHVYDKMGRGVDYEEAVEWPAVAVTWFAVLLPQYASIHWVGHQLAVHEYFAVPGQDDRALGGERVEVGRVGAGPERRPRCAPLRRRR